MIDLVFREDESIIHIDSETQGAIGEIYNDLDLEDERAQAASLARLFCASPELLNQLRIALNLIQKLRDQGGSFDEWAIEEEAAICDALEEATGEIVYPSWIYPEDREEYAKARKEAE